jgi:hypothetical protein
MVTRPALWVGILVLVGLGVRLLFAFVPGYLDDTRAWAILAEFAANHQFAETYGLVLQTPALGTYPPLYYAVLQGAGLAHRAFFDAGMTPGTFSTNLTLKLVPILGDCLLALVVYQAARDLRGSRYALGCLLYFTFNTAILCNTAYWGMFGDSLYTLFIVAALWQVTRRQWSAAVVCLVLAVHLKPQALFFAPLITAAILVPYDTRRWLRVGGVALVTVALVWLPVVTAGTLPQAFEALGKIARQGAPLTVNAHNLWYLATLGNPGPLDTVNLWLPLPARTLGIVAFLTANLAAWRTVDPLDGSTLFGAASLVGLAAFVFLTQLHENYLYPTVALLAVMWRRSVVYTVFAIALSFTSLLNMAMHDYFLPLSSYLPRLVSFAGRMVNSALNVLVFFAWTALICFKRSVLYPSRVDHDSLFRPQKAVHHYPVRN